MKRIEKCGLSNFANLVAIALVGWCGTTASAQTPTANQASSGKYVIVVSLDGLAAFLVDDPKATLPTVRKLAEEGAIAVGGMKVSNPSVTWPNHTTLITGVHPAKHGVLANGVLVRGGPGVPTVVDPKRDRSDLVRSMTLPDLAHRAGLRTAEINWPCTRASASYDDSFPDVPETLTHTTPRLRTELVELGLLDDETDKAFSGKIGVARDWVWTEAACHLIRTRQPQLLLVHLLNVDSTHHAIGPQTTSGYMANAYADLCLDRILRATQEAGIAERTTVLVVSDHGFIATPKSIRPNVMLRDAGLLKQVDNRITEARVHVFPEGGTGLLYVTNPGEAKELRSKIELVFEGKEGVAELIFPERFAELGLPLPREYEQAPDAILAAKPGYLVSAAIDGDEFVVTNVEGKASLGSHGYLSSDPRMNGLCVLWGNGIKAGVKLHDVENVDIAPTIAELLRLDRREVEQLQFDGKVLREALE